jgi:hypothetical protein
LKGIHWNINKKEYIFIWNRKNIIWSHFSPNSFIHVQQFQKTSVLKFKF